VAETAYYLGFTDPAYFSRFFSKHAGESPASFRKRMVRD
jgi:AraC family transcriptional regulator, transcriptional activator of pobA